MSRGNPTLDRRQLLRIFGAVAAAGATAGFASACATDLASGRELQPSGLTIRVGLVLPSGGPLAHIGDEIRRGFTLYLESNANMLGPHKVELLIEDEGLDTQSAIDALNRLVSQSVVAIVGVVNPDALLDAALAVQDRQIPLINPYAAPSTLTNAVFVWRVGTVIGDSGRALGEYARLSGERVYVMHDGTTYGRREFEGFSGAFIDRGGQIINADIEGMGDLSSRFSAAIDRDADTIFAAFSGDEAVQVVRAYLSLSGTPPKLVGTGNLTESIDLATVGALPSGRPIYTSMYYAPNLDNDANRRFVTEFHRRHGTQPTSYALSGYDAAAVLGRAAILVPTSPEGLRINQAISRLGQIESPRGTWTFNINRSPQQKWYLRRLTLDGMVPTNQLEADLAVLG